VRESRTIKADKEDTMATKKMAPKSRKENPMADKKSPREIADNKRWQAEHDAGVMKEHVAIMNDPKRRSEVHDHMEKEMANMKTAISKSRPKPSDKSIQAMLKANKANKAPAKTKPKSKG
jgi:phosphoenolpyruvate-protein kinase (PTS system EI component)